MYTCVIGFVNEGNCDDDDMLHMLYARVELVTKRTAYRRPGGHIGYMHFPDDGMMVEVFEHPEGTYYGYVSGYVKD